MLAELALTLALDSASPDPRVITNIQVVQRKKHHKKDVIPLVLACSLDLATTEIGLHRGLQDHNPIAQFRPLMYGGKALQVWFVSRNVDYLRRTGHRRMARVLKYGAIGLNLLAAGYNVRQIRNASK